MYSSSELSLPAHGSRQQADITKHSAYKAAQRSGWLSGRNAVLYLRCDHSSCPFGRRRGLSACGTWRLRPKLFS